MTEIKTTEELMLFLINLFSERYPQSAILKGGMALRLLDCPRFTNDLDYIFIPYRSKKDVVNILRHSLDGIDDLVYQYSLNSKCLRVKIAYNEITTQIEINVAEDCPSTAITTEALAAKTGQLSRVIRVMDFKEAMAHKLAAWNERHLVRDLYDLHFFYAYLNILPAIDTLMKRLEKVNSTPRNKNPKSMSLDLLLHRLRSTLQKLSKDHIEELSDYLPSENLPGLDLRIRANLLKMCDDIETQYDR